MIITFDSKKPPNQNPNLNSTNEKSFLIENNHDKIFKATKRSKNGCVTCKIRKKKCDEHKPNCYECERLKKECVWVDYNNMDESKIKEIKKIVEKSESLNKLRKRRKSIKSAQSASSPDIQNLIHPKDDYELFVPLSPGNSSYVNELVAVTSNIRQQPLQQRKEEVVVEEVDAEEEDDEQEDRQQDNEKQIRSGLVSLPSNQIVPINSNNVITTTSPINSNSPNEFYNYLKDFSSEFLQDFNFMSPESPSFSQLFQNITAPSPQMNLSPVSSRLSERSLELYNYYVNVLTPKLSVAPKSNNKDDAENYYQKVFLPLAHNDEGVMNSILAWASFYSNNQTTTEEGSKYIEKALKHFNSMTSTDRNTIINKIATVLVLLGAEICRGDIKNWLSYMEWGSKLLQSNGGLSNFNKNKQEFWLISNFAYHDVLSSNTTERGTYFTTEEYNVIFSHDLTSGILNPLFGIAKDIYPIIGEISHLSFETNKNLKDLTKELNDQNISDSPIYEVKESIDRLSSSSSSEFDETGSDLSNHAKINNLLLSVIEKAKKLNEKIDDAKPNKNDLCGLNEEEFEWQITLFETFKLSSKLYLRQSICKCNPSTLESQVLNNDLVKCLDIVLGSPVESVLVFPVFISAIHCVSQLDRTLMRKRIDKFIKTYGRWSIIRAREVVETIWQLNPNGDKVTDWHAILKDLGWEINFA